MSNAFHWEGKPSIFTTNGSQHAFSEAKERSRFATSMRNKAMPVLLDNSSPHLQPAMQKKGARRARK